jgi:nucleoside-diphosphate-sugar epimerase
MIPGDVLNKSSIEEGMEGCNIIFHCAYGNTNDSTLNSQINEIGTTNVCETALKRRVKKLVHISSVAVYGSNPPAEVNEKTPIAFSDDDYGNSKIRAEIICHKYIAKGLPITIIRPTIVFGPFSPIWTIGIIKRILGGAWETVEGINGLCNPVYIDDLVDSLFLSINSDKTVGQIFIVSGEKPITWNQYFSTHIRLTNSPSPKRISENRRRLKAFCSSFLRINILFLRRFFEPQIQNIYHSLKENNPYLTDKVERMIRGGIRNNEVKRFSQRTIYSIQKARQILNYSPRSFDDGMRVTAEWLRHHRHI